MANGLNHQFENSFHATIEIRLGKLATLYSLHNTLNLGISTRLDKVVARPNLLGSIVATAPIRNNDTLETPLITQDGFEQTSILRGVATIDIVVRGHNHPRLRLLDRNLEVFEIYLTQGSLRNTGIIMEAIELLIIHGKVLWTSTHTLALDSVYHSGRHLTC